MSMYDKGLDDGYQYAINRAFGDKKPAEPYFETEKEMNDYYAGFEDGYDSVD